MSSTKFVFCGPIGKTRWVPWPLIDGDIFDFFSGTAYQNWTNLTGSKISMYCTKFVFFGPICKPRWPPWSLIGWDIFDFFSETASRNSTKLDRKKDLNALYQVWAYLNTKIAALVSDWWDIFDFFCATAEWNLTKLNRKEDLKVLYQVCVFRADQKTKMTAIVSDWLTHFRLLLCNHWTELNKISPSSATFVVFFQADR